MGEKADTSREAAALTVTHGTLPQLRRMCRALVDERDFYATDAATAWNKREERRVENDALAARLRLAEAVCEAAGIYFDDYCQDEADSPDCCVEIDQHDAALALKDTLAAYRAAAAVAETQG